MKKLKVLVLVHKDLVPPTSIKGLSIKEAPWRTEYEVVKTLKSLGHEIKVVGLYDDLKVLRQAIDEFNPHIVYNLLIEFNGNTLFEQNIVSYLELLNIPYTGCNPRGLMITRDKALSKKILKYHQIALPKFMTVPRGQKFKRNKNLKYPLIVKSLVEDASRGISQASIVHSEKKLIERIEFIHNSIETDALIEEYIEGREFYVSLLGNKKFTIFPLWELDFTKTSKDINAIATERVKWNEEYRKKHNIKYKKAQGLDDGLIKKIEVVSKKICQILNINGYIRLDMRISIDNKIYLIEANPNPGISLEEEYTYSARAGGLDYEELQSKILTLGLSWFSSEK